MTKGRTRRRAKEAGGVEPAPASPPTAAPAPDSVGTSPTVEPVGLLQNAPAVLGGVFLLTFVIVAVRRIRYPFTLEWVEGGLLDEMRWLLAGHNLYVRPSVDYVPFIYNPLYLWTCAGVAKVLGASFFTMRLVSLASTLGTFGLLYALVVRETRSRAAGIAGAGLYAATFKLTQQFMDLARVDALFVLLAVAAVWALRARPTAWGRAAAAALLVLCFLAKQSGLLVAAPLVGFVLWDRRARGVPFALAVVGGIGASAWLLDATSDGWYRYFAFTLPGGHRLVPTLWADFWSLDVMGSLGCAALGALFVLFGPAGLARRERALWGAALLGVLSCSWSSRLHDGGWSNVLMPTYAILAALFAVALHAALDLASRAALDVRRGLEVFLPLAATVQLAALLYNPSHLVPTPRDEQAGWRLVSTLRAVRGDTWTPADSYLATLAGKRPHLNQMAVNDVLRGPQSDVSATLVADIEGALAQRRWSVIITDDEFFAADVLASYQRGPDAVGEPDVFTPVAGATYRPGSLFTPR